MLHIPLKISRKFIQIQIVLYCLAMLSICLVPMPWGLKFILCLALFVGLGLSLLRQRNTPDRLQYTAKTWSVLAHDGTRYYAEVRNAFISRYLVILCLRGEALGRVNFIFTPDTLERQDYRKLCRALKHP